jgi:effector-binding domain-containing protein
VHDAVQLKQVSEQPIAVVRGRATMANLPVKIRELFDQFYAGFKGKGGLNIVFYPGDVAGEFEIACGVQLEQGGNASTPAGAVATTVYMGPYDQMKPAHHAIHQWVRENGRQIAGPSWEVYGHWSDDPAKLRTDIYYLLK